MSVEYRGYFHLKHRKTKIDKLPTFLKEYHLQYEDCPSHFVWDEEGLLQEQLYDRRIGWSEFLQQVDDPNSQMNASVTQEQEEFYFMLGFVTKGGEKFGILEFSSGNLEGLSYFMKHRYSDVLQFFVSLYQALNTEAMVWGKELSFEEALAFLKGSLAPETIRDYICTVVGVLPTRSLELLRSYGGRDFTIGNLKGVTQPFIGLEELPASRVNRSEPVLVTTRPGITENLMPVLAMKYPELQA